ncbi:uncharacterized protein LOC107630830 [Arachis ipaensis]|uniref:DUF4408 domain-containing protein n=1 Tax=Arachis hypogaea TaxID=3818 RepID=A0A444ZYL1_ARAHY|nr:uncharacterized protein LOC107630830 [Arachis ipaensis]XP_025637444.1 uncharacterized protein LOC112732851 [Arachis hypogaea]QHO02167.1 uncharacterized protein DS421_13g421520 [Arachis hypogaea]RYR19259.1 hypothetical protein Ahy_B03g063991 [Arachis hypogaea]
MKLNSPQILLFCQNLEPNIMNPTEIKKIHAMNSVNISGLVPILLSSKLLFIIGNIIIFVLMFNSRVLSSSSYYTSSTTNNVLYDEYINNCQMNKPQIPTHLVINAEEKFEKRVGENYSTTLEELKGNKEWVKEVAEAKEEKNTDEKAEESSLVCSCSDDLNKRAEDFIARVNRQRRLELTLVHCDSY